MFQGFYDPRAKHHTDTPWACEAEDYPVVYFVGFKVKDVANDGISASRAKGVLNVVSIKTIDPDLDKHTRVTDSQTGAVLCDDIAAGCIKQIFYGRW